MSKVVCPSIIDAAIIRFSVPVTETLGKEKFIGFKFFASRYMYLESDLISAPIFSRPDKWKSIGRVPMSQPPGWEIFAFPYFANSGPITRIEALIVLTNSYLASGKIIFDESISIKPSSLKLIDDPMELSNSSFVVMSCKCGRFPISAFPSKSIVEASKGNPEFFAPEQSTSPWRWLPPFMINLSIF